MMVVALCGVLLQATPPASTGAPPAPTGALRAPAQAPPTSREADERLAMWLEGQGLDRLLEALLEDRLGREVGDLDRRDLAERLSEVMTRRLRRGELEPEAAATSAAKFRGFLPAVDADSLLLEILRAKQRREEKRLERTRLGRAAPEDDPAAAVRAFIELATECERLRRNFEVDLRNDDRRLDRSVGLDAEELLELVDRKRALLESTRFLQAWANLHLAMLARSSLLVADGDAANSRLAPDARQRATAALEAFNMLLDTGQVDPGPEDVSVDRRSEEPYASAMLGAAIGRALLQGGAAATPWFALLADQRTASMVRRSASGWRLGTLVLLRDFSEARALLEELAQRGPVPTAWLRLSIVECASPQVLALPGAVEFVHAALAQLAAQEELGEVVELSDRLPSDALPNRGFVAGYVRGLREYAAARSMSAGQAEAFQNAASTLRAALREPDAAALPVARAAARQLAAWCLVGAGDPGAASALFEDAADELPASRAAESLWLAAEAAERAAAQRSGEERRELERASARIIDKLLQRHPGSAEATRAEVARIRGDEDAGGKELARLLAVPRGSPAWPEALRTAEALLYRLFRSAPESDRARLAAQYLELAREDEAPPGAVRRTWLRRRIEASLAIGAARVDDATVALESIRARAAAGEFLLDDLADELRLRELQIAALEQRLADATSTLRAMEAGSTERAVLRIARRSILRASQRTEGDAAHRITVAVGGEILADEGSELDDGAFRAIALVMARAFLRLPEGESSAASEDATPAKAPGSATAPGSAAGSPPASGSVPRLTPLEALQAARTRAPTDVAIVDQLAALAERHGDDALALECLRALLAARNTGEPEWFDARLRQLRILVRLDPPRARAVLDQHRALVPGWGPEPWGSELRELDRRVPVSTSESDS